MRKYIIKFLGIGLIFCSVNVFSQTGINTRTPEQSSILDISATDKGVLMPKHILVNLTDDSSPISNPVEGTLIYNTGGVHKKGYYYWDGDMWNRLIVNNEMEQIFNIQIPIGDNEVLIPANTYSNNFLDFSDFPQTEIISSIEEASVSGQYISLPAGKYKVDITLTSSAPTTSSNSSSRLFPNTDSNRSLDLYGVDVELFLGTTSLAPMKYASTISGTGSHNNIQGYRYSFVFELTSAVTNLRFNIKHSTGRTNDQRTNLAHTGLMINFRKFLE